MGWYSIFLFVMGRPNDLKQFISKNVGPYSQVLDFPGKPHPRFRTTSFQMLPGLRLRYPLDRHSFFTEGRGGFTCAGKMASSSLCAYNASISISSRNYSDLKKNNGGNESRLPPSSLFCSSSSLSLSSKQTTALQFFNKKRTHPTSSSPRPLTVISMAPPKPGGKPRKGIALLFNVNFVAVRVKSLLFSLSGFYLCIFFFSKFWQLLGW